MRTPRIFQSSKGDGSLSRTVKGILTALIPVIIALAEANNVALSEDALTQIIQNVTAILALLVTTYGIVLKIVNRNRAEAERL